MSGVDVRYYVADVEARSESAACSVGELMGLPVFKEVPGDPVIGGKFRYVDGGWEWIGPCPRRPISADPENTGAPVCEPECHWMQVFSGYDRQRNALRIEATTLVQPERCGWNLLPGRIGGHPLDYAPCSSPDRGLTAADLRAGGCAVSRAPDWETRKLLRQLRGRPAYWVTVTRLDPHAKNSKRARTIDPLGPDPLEEMKQWRGPQHPSLPKSFGDHRRNAYASARQRALSGSPLAQLRMIEAAIGCDLDCRAAVQAWRAVA